MYDNISTKGQYNQSHISVRCWSKSIKDICTNLYLPQGTLFSMSVASQETNTNIYILVWCL